MKLFHKFTTHLNKMKRASNSKGPNNAKQAKTTTGFWANGLLSAMKDPELQVKDDELVVVIKDKYPKAKFHYLVLPKEDIHSLKSADESHLSLLEHMHKIGMDLTQEDIHKESKFKLGYHSQASMARLHLHVISDDMNSECLKTKKLWNSFTTDFFVSSESIIKSLKAEGKVSLKTAEECKKLMSTTPMKCHECSYTSTTIPNLKKHILQH